MIQKLSARFRKRLKFNDKDVETMARDALIRNLPLLKASDGEFLNDDQRKCCTK